MRPLTILVRAQWDDEAKVWIATSPDIDGLVTESASLDELRDKVLVMIGELLELNGEPSSLPELPVRFLAEQLTSVANPHYC